MNDDMLRWNDVSSKELLKTRVFSVHEKHSIAENGVEGDYVYIGAPDWVVIVPVRDGKFVLVHQWRHGQAGIVREFPGGIVDAGEAPADAAARELEEETAYHAEKLTKLGEVNPNPAIFSNTIHVFLAEELSPLKSQSLDEDEFINCEEIPISDFISVFGTGEYVHAYTGTALAFYMRHKNRGE